MAKYKPFNIILSSFVFAVGALALILLVLYNMFCVENLLFDISKNLPLITSVFIITILSVFTVVQVVISCIFSVKSRKDKQLVTVNMNISPESRFFKAEVSSGQLLSKCKIQFELGKFLKEFVVSLQNINDLSSLSDRERDLFCQLCQILKDFTYLQDERAKKITFQEILNFQSVVKNILNLFATKNLQSEADLVKDLTIFHRELDGIEKLIAFSDMSGESQTFCCTLSLAEVSAINNCINIFCKNLKGWEFIFELRQFFAEKRSYISTMIIESTNEMRAQASFCNSIFLEYQWYDGFYKDSLSNKANKGQIVITPLLQCLTSSDNNKKYSDLVITPNVESIMFEEVSKYVIFTNNVYNLCTQCSTYEYYEKTHVPFLGKKIKNLEDEVENKKEELCSLKVKMENEINEIEDYRKLLAESENKSKEVLNLKIENNDLKGKLKEMERRHMVVLARLRKTGEECSFMSECYSLTSSFPNLGNDCLGAGIERDPASVLQQSEACSTADKNVFQHGNG